MRQQHAPIDGSILEYVDELCSARERWLPSHARGEHALGIADALVLGADASDETMDDVVTALHAVQYAAHVATDFVAAADPPPSAEMAHARLVYALEACRDTLAVLAVRAELDDLDDSMTSIGRDALDIATCAFAEAANATAPTVADAQIILAANVIDVAQTSWSRRATMAVWCSVGLAGLAFLAILIELLVLTPASG